MKTFYKALLTLLSYGKKPARLNSSSQKTLKILKALLIINFSLLIYTSHAQSFILYGDKTFGTNRIERWVNMADAGNGQLILEGSSVGNVNGDKTDPLCDSVAGEGIWILKIDMGFNILWDKDLGGGIEQQPFLIMTSNNKQMIFSCLSMSDSACEKSQHNRSFPGFPDDDYWICMLDSNGNKIWDRTLGGQNVDDYPHIIELTTGEFIISGTSGSGIDGDKTVANFGLTDYWVVKLDNSGNKIWDKVYGGTGAEMMFFDNGVGSALLPVESGGFILAGTTRSSASGLVTDTSNGHEDIWIIKCDSAGTKIWDRLYGGGVDERCHNIIRTPDGGYMICGSTNSQQGFDVSQISRGADDVWLIKLDSIGNKEWEKRYGGNMADVGYGVENAPGGGYWVSGVTNSDSSFEVSEPSYGAQDYWIFKIDNLGNKIWDKRFGGPGGDVGSNFIIMPDTSIYFFGYAGSGTSAVKTDAGKGSYDYWLVHFKYGYTFTGVNELAAGMGQLAIVPNPAITTCTINLNNLTTQQLNNPILTLYDITGRALLQQPFNTQAQLNLSPFSAGIYIIEVRDKEGRSVKGKLVKE